MKYLETIFKNNLIFIFITFMMPILFSVSSKSTVLMLFMLSITSFFYSKNSIIRIPLNKVALAIVVISVCWFLFRALHIELEGQSLGLLAKIMVICGAGFILYRYVIALDETERARIARFLIWGVFVSITIILIGCLLIDTGYAEVLRAGRSDQKSIFSAGVIFISLMCPILIYYNFPNNKLLLLFLLLSFFIIILISQSFAAILAVIVGAILSLFIFYFGAKGVNIIKVCLIVFTLAVPIIFPQILTGVREIVLDPKSDEIEESVGVKGSIAHRYYIWKFTIDRALEHPIIGWGLDASRSLPGGDVNIGVGRELMPLHPHNAFLQIWVELGYVGLILLAAIIWLIFPKAPSGQAFDKKMAILPITISMLVVIMNLSFGIWQSWWMSAIALIICFASLANAPTRLKSTTFDR